MQTDLVAPQQRLLKLQHSVFKKSVAARVSWNFLLKEVAELDLLIPPLRTEGRLLEEVDEPAFVREKARLTSKNDKLTEEWLALDLRMRALEARSRNLKVSESSLEAKKVLAEQRINRILEYENFLVATAVPDITYYKEKCNLSSRRVDRLIEN